MKLMQEDDYWMAQALKLAQDTQNQSEVPVGAVVVLEGRVVGEGWNAPIQTHDPTNHAEIMAIRKAASKLKNYRLTECELFVTLQPCTMCLGAMEQARIKRLVFGTFDPKKESTKRHYPREVNGGVLAKACGQILSDFFGQRRS